MDTCTVFGCEHTREQHFVAGETMPCSKCGYCKGYRENNGKSPYPDGANANVVDSANFMHQMSRFVALSMRKRALNAELKLVEADLEALDEPLREQMSEHGMQNLRANGLTVYINRLLMAGPAKSEVVLPNGQVEIVSDRQRTCEALIASGQAQFVEPSFNSISVSAWIRELDKDDNEMPILPPELVGNITITEKYSLRTRK